MQPKPEHIRPALPCVQAPLVQVPVLPQGGLGEHWPAGAGPLAIGVQFPGLVPAQVWHVPHPPALQHTPSTQLPVVHSCPVPHALPGVFFARQEPFVPVQ